MRRAGAYVRLAIAYIETFGGAPLGSSTPTTSASGSRERERSVRHAEQAGDGDVLVDVGPVDSGPGPDESPMIPLLRSGVAETRKPLDGNDQRPPVLQVHDEGVGDEFDSPGARLRGLHVISSWGAGARPSHRLRPAGSSGAASGRRRSSCARSRFPSGRR